MDDARADEGETDLRRALAARDPGATIAAIGPERAWLGAFAALVASLALGSLLFTKTVWNRFVWQYFWGPVYADAHDSQCAVMESGGPQLLFDAQACRNAAASGLAYAEPGYTLVSEVGYMVLLLFFLIGVFLLLRRLEVADDVRLYLPLVPFMLFGGALRVVEDAFDAARSTAGASPPLTYPLTSLIISPVIYVVVFAVTLLALLAALQAEDRGYVDSYRRTLGAIGLAALGLTLAYLTVVGLTTEYAAFYPQMTIATVGIATAISYALWRGLHRRWPDVIEATGVMSLVVLWGQAIDGVANVLAADWLGALGFPAVNYTAKHPANRAVIAITESVQPAALSNLIGTSWPFLAVKLGVASLVVLLFTDEFLDESPRYALLLLVAVTAVGLGPGTRDMLRVTFLI